MRALCVGRHPYLSEHLGRFFGRLGLDTVCVTGLELAASAAESARPDVVLCDYDLLGSAPLDIWELHPVLSRVPIIAVSLTRRPEEVVLVEMNGIAGFLYLPILKAEDARRILGIARPPASYSLPSVLDRPASLVPPPSR